MDIQPANCYARAQRLLGELRLIGAEMGRSPDTRALPEIKDAAPRECYFEALALFAKADRLNQELTGDPTDGLPHPPALAQLRPQHVLEVIDAALRELDMVKADLQLAERAAEPALEPARQPSDVLRSLIDANRQLGRLLERPFTPSDVYRQVGLASTYAARLVARAGATAPAPAPFVRGKRPADCYDKLLACLARLGAIARAGGQTVLDVRGALPTLGVLALGTGNAWAHATEAPPWRTAIEQVGRLARSGAPTPLVRYRLVGVQGTTTAGKPPLLAHYAGTGWDAEIIDDFHGQKQGPGLLPASRRMGLAGYLHGVFTRTVPRNIMRGAAEVELINTGNDALTVDDRGKVVALPGGEHGKVLYRGPAGVCAAGTCPEWGFGFRAFPFARLRNDRFNMRVCSGGPAWAALHMRALWKGTHPYPNMHTWLLDGCRAVFSRPVPLQAGGDRLGHESVVDYTLSERTVDLVDWRALRT